jgi:hypothetical protein
MLAVAVMVGGLMTFTHKDTAYLLVLVWAFVGIAAKFPAEPLVNTAAWTASAVVCLLVVITVITKVIQRTKS